MHLLAGSPALAGVPDARRAAGRRGRLARTLLAMHGMLSAAIVIGVFAVAAAACLYVAVRAFTAGGRRGDAS